MSRISDLTCNETMSDDAERGIVSGSSSLSRRYQLAPTQSPGSFRVAQPVSRYTATSVGKPGARGGYTVASTNRSATSAHTIKDLQIHRSYTVAAAQPHLSQINSSINNVQLSTSQAQQATANRIMRTHPVPDPGDYGLYPPNVVMTHNQVVRPSVSSREIHGERVVSSRAAYRVERPPSIREERVYRQEPTIMREILREEIPQPQIVHRAHGVVPQTHPQQQHQPQMNLYINSMRLTQPPAPQATAKIGVGALHSVQQMSKNSDRSNSYSPSVRAYSTTPSGLQRTVTPTTSHPTNPSRFTPVNGNSVQPSIVRPVPTTPARIVQSHVANHGLLQPPTNPMTHAIPDSPTPVQQFMNLQRTTTTQSPRPSILRTPGSAAKRKLALAGLENTSCTNGNNSALSSAVRSLSATSITTVTKGILGDASTTPEPSPRKRQRKQQLEPTPTLLEAMKHQQLLQQAQAKAQLEAAQRAAEAEKEAWMAKALASKQEEPAKKKRGRPKSDGQPRPTTAGPVGKTLNKTKSVRTAGSVATQRFLADQEAKYRASQAAADDSYEYQPDGYDFTTDPSTSTGNNLNFEFAATSNEPQPKSVIAQRCLAQQRAAAVQQYAAQQLATTQKTPNNTAGGMQRPPQTATAPALAPATHQVKKQKGPRIKHSIYPSTSKQQTNPKEEPQNLRSKRIGARRNLNVEKDPENPKDASPAKPGSNAINTPKNKKTETNPVQEKILSYLAEAIQAQMKRKSNDNNTDGESRTEKMTPRRTKAQIAALREAIVKAAEAAKLPPKDKNLKLPKAKSMDSLTKVTTSIRPSRKPSAPQRGSTPSAGPVRRSISVPDGKLGKEVPSTDKKEGSTNEDAKQNGKKVKISRIVLKKRVKMKKKKDEDPTKEFRGEIAKPTKMRVQLPVISLTPRPNLVEFAKKHTENAKKKQDSKKKKCSKKYEKELNCDGLYPQQTRWASIFLAGLMRKRQQKRQVVRKLNKLRRKRQINTSIPMCFRKLETTTPPKSRGISIMAGMKPEESRPNHFEQPKYVHKALTLRQEMISNLRKQQRLDRADNLIAKRSAKALLHKNEVSISHLCSSFENNAEGSLTNVDEELLIESLKNILQKRDDPSKFETVSQLPHESSKQQCLNIRKLKSRVIGLRRKGVIIYTKKELQKAKQQIVQVLPNINCGNQPDSEQKTFFDKHLNSTSEDKQLPDEYSSQLRLCKPVTVTKGRNSEALLCVSTSFPGHYKCDNTLNSQDSKASNPPQLQQYFVVHRFRREANLKSLLNKLAGETDETKKQELRLKIRKELSFAQDAKQKSQVEQTTLDAVRKLRLETFDQQMKTLIHTAEHKTVGENSTHTKKTSREDRTTTSLNKTVPTVAVGSIVEKHVVRLNKEDLPVVLTKRFFLEKHPLTTMNYKTANCHLELKKRKQILRYEPNSAGVPVPRVSKVVNFRLPFPIENDFSRPKEDQLKDEVVETVSVSGTPNIVAVEKLEENQSATTEDCKSEDINEEPLEETSLSGRSATFAGSSTSTDTMTPVKPVRKDKHLLILEEAMRNLSSKKGDKHKPSTGQPSTFSIPMLKCTAASPSTPKSQSKIKSKQDKTEKQSNSSKEEQRPRSKSESDQNSKKSKEKIRAEKDKKKEDAKKIAQLLEAKETVVSSEESEDLCEKGDTSSCKTTTDVAELTPLPVEPTKIIRVYESTDLRKIDKGRVISQRIMERNGKLIKVIKMRKDPETTPKSLLQLTENQLKVIKQCKKLPVKHFLQTVVAPLVNEERDEDSVSSLLDDMIQYISRNSDSAEAKIESDGLLAKAFAHPMAAIAPTFRSVIEVLKPKEEVSIQLTENQFTVGSDMQNQLWWKVAAKKDLPTEEEALNEVKLVENELKCNTDSRRNDDASNKDYDKATSTVLRPYNRKAIKLVRPSKISRAVALLQQYSSRVEDQMTLERTTLLAFETFLQQYDPKSYHELQLNLLRDYEEGDTIDIVEEKKMLRLRHTILLPPIEFLPNKKPDYGDICKSVVMNPTEEFQNQVMKSCSTFWRGKLNGNPSAMHLNRYGHQIVDRCEGFIPLQSDHKEFYLEDVQDLADKNKFEKYYTMFEQNTEKIDETTRFNCVNNEVNENKTNKPSSVYNGVSRRAVLKQGSTEILFMGEKPVNGMISPVVSYKLDRCEADATVLNQVRNIREIFATSFKAMHETTQIMMQTRELMVQSLALRSSREALRRLQLAKQRVRQTKVKTKTPKPNVVTLLKKLRRRLHRQKSLALRELSNPETTPANKEKQSQNALKTKFAVQKQAVRSVKIGLMPPFKPPTMTATLVTGLKRKQLPVYGSPTKKLAVEDNGKPAPKVTTNNEKPMIITPKVEIPKIIEPVAHRGIVNRGGRPPLRKHSIGRGGSIGDRKPVPEEVKEHPVAPVVSVRGGAMGRGLGRGGSITRVARGSGMSRGAHRSISSSTSSSNNDIVGITVPATEPVEKIAVVRKPHKPRVPKTPTIASDSTFERQMRRAIQESLRDVPSSSKTAAGK